MVDKLSVSDIHGMTLTATQTVINACGWGVSVTEMGPRDRALLKTGADVVDKIAEMIASDSDTQR